jgi:hypothetical protein
MQRFTGRTTAAGSGSVWIVARDLPSAGRLQLASTGSAANMGPLVRPREAAAIERLAQELAAHRGDPQAIRAVSIDMSPACFKGVEQHLPNATVTFD